MGMPRTGQLSLSLVSYNVSGLKNKIADSFFVQFICTYVIFFLIETHVEYKNFDIYSDVFVDYTLHWISAKKTATVGRASGGLLCGIHRGWENLIYCELSDEKMAIHIRNHTTTTVVPVYLNPSSWDNDFNKLSDLLQSERLKRVVVIGDFNARIGSQQSLPEEMLVDSYGVEAERKSRDIIVNKRGSKVITLCDENDLIILNGRSLGDAAGEYTFFGGMGKSVIDLCCVTDNVLPDITGFRVRQELFSDHKPVELVLGLNDTAKPSCGPRVQKLKWNEQFAGNYRKKLQLLVSRDTHLEEDADSEIRRLKESVVQAGGGRSRGKAIIECRRSPWFDWECDKKRQSLFKILNMKRANRSDFLE